MLFPCSQTCDECLFAGPGLVGCPSAGTALGACGAADTSRALLRMNPAEPGTRCRGVQRWLRVWSVLTCRALEQRREIKSHLYKKPNEFCGGSDRGSTQPQFSSPYGAGGSSSSRAWCGGQTLTPPGNLLLSYRIPLHGGRNPAQPAGLFQHFFCLCSTFSLAHWVRAGC